MDKANPYLDSTSSFLEMLSEIVENDNKKTAEECISVAPIAFWTQLFAKYFLHINHPHHDDLLFYVKKDPDGHTEKSEVKVFRRESPRNPGLGDPTFDWTETVYLNLILQQLKYKLTCAICTKSNSENVIIHRKVSQEVYASPSRHDMEAKGPSAEMSYPNIFFTIDSFDEIWTDLILSEGEMVCVEIVAHDKSNDFISVIFLGSVQHSALESAYEKKTNSRGNVNKWASVMTLGLYKPPNEVQFVRMKGPGGKGYAEMAIELCKNGKSYQDDETLATTSLTASKSEPESLHKHALPKRKPQNYLTAVQRNTSGGATASVSTPVSPSSPSKSSLKTQLTYVTLPWHKIILDVLKTYECPAESKKPVLGI